jgi:hypothetical protein
LVFAVPNTNVDSANVARLDAAAVGRQLTLDARFNF